MSRVLYLKALIEHGACEASTRLFEKMFGDHVDVTVELAVSMSSVFALHACPALPKLLSEEGVKEYNKITYPAWAKYEKIESPAWEKYKKIIDPAWEEYEKTIATAWATAYIREEQ